MCAEVEFSDSAASRPAAGLLDAEDPYGEVRDASHAKETLRGIYGIADTQVGAATVAQLAQDLQDPGMRAEINRLGRTLRRWRHAISNWHTARVTNAATEAANTSTGGRLTPGGESDPAANWPGAFRLNCRLVPGGGARTDRSSGCNLTGALDPTP